jgi:8-oxo-dGTP diphosphatase
MMTQPLLVTCAIITKENKYLITQRRPTDHNAGRWEFPGGKVDFGEDPRKGLEREIKEELGIVVKAHELLDYSSFVYEGKKHIVLLGIHCDYVSGEIEHREVADHAWVTKKEMESYDMTEADPPLMKKLKDE